MLATTVYKSEICNETTGIAVDIIYAANHQPPDLPIAVIVKFDNYTGPSKSAIPNCVPIPPITASVNAYNSLHERQQIPQTFLGPNNS